MKTKYEKIIESVDRNYPNATDEQKKRIVKHEFAHWLSRGYTIGKNLDTGKMWIDGPPVALRI